MHRIKYEVTDIGIDYPDYFQGFGASCTKYDEAVTGIGDTYNEALSDALTMLCEFEPVSANQADAIERKAHMALSHFGEISASEEQRIDVSNELTPHDYECSCPDPAEKGEFCDDCHDDKVKDIIDNCENSSQYYVGILYTLTPYQKKG